MLASAGVLIGFSGTGGTPLIAASEIEWLSPQSEYRPTEYVQGWMSFWFDEEKRLYVAKQFQKLRISYLESVWLKDRDLQSHGFYADDMDVSSALPHRQLRNFKGKESRCHNRSLPHRQLRKIPSKHTSMPLLFTAAQAA